MIRVLDHGLVELVHHVGTDRSVAEAAWVSTDRVADRSDEEVERVIRYMARHDHWTPFGHQHVTLRLGMPIFVARQWMRSNVGIVYNEESRRYVDSPVQTHEPERWRARGKGVKQGSGAGFVEYHDHAHDARPDTPGGLSSDAVALREYETRLAAGIAPEQARTCLPLSMYTTFVMTGSLAAIARVCRLRLDPHAQEEARAYGLATQELVRPLFPVSWRYLVEEPIERRIVLRDMLKRVDELERATSDGERLAALNALSFARQRTRELGEVV